MFKHYLKIGNWSLEICVERSEMRGDRVLFVERANELAVCGKAKAVIAGAVAKASVNSAF